MGMSQEIMTEVQIEALLEWTRPKPEIDKGNKVLENSERYQIAMKHFTEHWGYMARKFRQYLYDPDKEMWREILADYARRRNL